MKVIEKIADRYDQLGSYNKWLIKTFFLVGAIIIALTTIQYIFFSPSSERVEPDFSEESAIRIIRSRITSEKFEITQREYTRTERIFVIETENASYLARCSYGDLDNPNDTSLICSWLKVAPNGEKE